MSLDIMNDFFVYSQSLCFRISKHLSKYGGPDIGLPFLAARRFPKENPGNDEIIFFCNLGQTYLNKYS